jgi:hypothetical protein
LRLSLKQGRQIVKPHPLVPQFLLEFLQQRNREKKVSPGVISLQDWPTRQPPSLAPPSYQP